MKDACSVLGQIFEELIRHYPKLLPVIMDALIDECRQVSICMRWYIYSKLHSYIYGTSFRDLKHFFTQGGWDMHDWTLTD